MATSRGSKLVIVPTAQAYQEYASWWAHRKLAPPPPPNLGIFVAHVDYGLVTGACVFTTDGPIALLEHFSVNPKNMLIWKAAATRTLLEFRRLATLLGKYPCVCADRKSLAKVCKEGGFQFSGARVMVAPMVMG
jgi:hypothetical protein